MSLQSIRTRLNSKAVAAQLPIGAEENMRGIIDLLSRKGYEFHGQNGEQITEVEIPADMTDKVETYRSELIERVVECDEVLMEKYLSGEEISIEDIKKAIRKGVIANELYPVLCGTALKNIGVQFVLDSVVDYLPSPLDVPEIFAHNPDNFEEQTAIKPADDAPFCALAFKIATDPFVGKLCFVRVYSGILSSGSYVMNSSNGKKERIGRLVRMHANHREEINEIHAGDIAAVIGLKDTVTGNTLSMEGKPMCLEAIVFPEPVIKIAVEPKTKADQEKMGVALGRLAEEDPTFRVETDEESSQTLISGMGELHLDIIVDRMKREFGVEANIGQPQVAYRETIRGKGEAEGKYVKQSGGRGQYGHCWVRLEPNEAGKGFEFIDEVKGGAIPREYIPAIGKGVKEAMDRGIVAGYPMVDVKAFVYDGSYHEVDSSEAAFKMAGIMAFRDACAKAGAVLLEPIMKVEVTTPEEYMGSVIGDLNAKRGQIESMTDRGNLKVIDAKVPLAEMFGYATALRSMSQGRANYSMEFDCYLDAPKFVVEKIVGERNKK